MSIQGVMAGGNDPKCIGVAGTAGGLHAASAGKLIIVPVTTQTTCQDGHDYPYKAILLSGSQAQAVYCIGPARLAELREMPDVVVLSAMPAALAGPVKCPPPEMTNDETATRLAQISAWASGHSHEPLISPVPQTAPPVV